MLPLCYHTNISESKEVKKRYQNILIIASALLIFSLAEHYVYAADSQRGVTIQERGQPSDIVVEGNYWAFIIGINDYANLPADKQLEAARPDAQSVAEILQKKYGFAQERIISLYDKEATRKNILGRLRTLSKTLSEKDNLLIYYAGHGQYEEDTQIGWWVPSDADLEDTSSFISNSDVREYLNAIKARHVYTVADSCFSKSLMRKTRSLDQGQLNEEAIKKLYRDKSRWILTSGGLYPVPDKGKENHSTFAHYFLRILERNEDRYLTPQQIIVKLQPLVSAESKQTPISAPIEGDDGGQFVFKNTAYAKIAPPADLKTKEDEVKLKEEQKRLEEERARAKEDLRKYKEELKKQFEEEVLKRERELKEKERKMEGERSVKEEEQKRRLEEERRRIENERQELEEKKKMEKKQKPAFIAPTF